MDISIIHNYGFPQSNNIRMYVIIMDLKSKLKRQLRIVHVHMVSYIAIQI